MATESYARIKSSKPGTLKPQKVIERMPEPIKDYAAGDKRGFINSVSAFMPGRGERRAHIKAILKNIITGKADQYTRIKVGQ